MTMKNQQSCLSAEILRQLSHDELPPGELESIEEHVSGCDRCRNLLETAQSDPQWQGEIVPILRAPLESPLATADYNDSGNNHESLRSILQLLGPTDDPHMLGRIGPYEVLAVIGLGGMGVVFKAYESALNRFVAIKMLLPHLAASGAARKRFARESQAAAAVIDDNVMPSNILLDGTVERALLTDFGLARAVDDASITKTGAIAGTPQYMSPEQARGGSVDARSDLFGLGCVLYAMCTGRPPFRAESSYTVLRMITDEEARSIREINPDIPEWLCLLISRLMAKSPDVRLGDASEVTDLLGQCLSHVQQPTSMPLPASLMSQAAGHRSTLKTFVLAGVIAMLATIGMALLAMVLWQATEAPDISGRWSSEEWGTVVLEAKQQGQYEGTMTGFLLGVDSSEGQAGKSGKIELHWSRTERRFNGIWSQGTDHAGKISLRLVDNEIRGVWTTSKTSEINSGTPELADLTWKRSVARAEPSQPAIPVQMRIAAPKGMDGTRSRTFALSRFPPS